MLLDEMVIDVDFNGIVLFSYPELKEFFGGPIQEGDNILKSFTETDLGDTIVDKGVVIPIINIDDGGYVLRIFDAPPPQSDRRNIVFSDEGYVLTSSRDVYVADAAVFWDWSEFLGWRKAKIEPGKYAVTVQGVQHLTTSGSIDRVGYDLVITKMESLPTRTAIIRSNSRV